MGSSQSTASAKRSKNVCKPYAEESSATASRMTSVEHSDALSPVNRDAACDQTQTNDETQMERRKASRSVACLRQYPPHKMRQLLELQSLDLHGKKLQSLPLEGQFMKSLVFLDVSSNNLTALPDWICDLKQLRKLIVMHNKLTQLPERIGELEELIFFEASHNRICQLPPSTQRWKKLLGLGLSDNDFAQFPASLNAMTQLQQLGLHSNRIRIVPETIGCLQRLKKLDLCRNRIASLPASFGNLLALEWHNQLTSLPKEASALANLVEMGLAHNRLTSITCLAGLRCLTSLIVYDNLIEELPNDVLRSLTAVQNIEASHNRIRIVPGQLFAMQALTKVNLQANCITAIQDLPEDAQFSTSLKILNLQNNKLKWLPAYMMWALKSLQVFGLNGNPFTQRQLTPRFKFASLQQRCVEIALNFPIACNSRHLPLTCFGKKAALCDVCKHWRVQRMQRHLLFVAMQLEISTPSSQRASNEADNFVSVRVPFYHYVCCKSEWMAVEASERSMH